MNNYPMVTEVNRLVANLLAGGGEVFLPGVGALYVEWRGVKQLSKNVIAPPARVVSFTSDQRGESLVAEIARTGSCDADAAQDIYDRWLSRVYVDGVLTVEGVGTLQSGQFTTEPDFDAILNPQGHAPVRIKRAHRFDWAIWIGIAAIFIAAAFCAYTFLLPALSDNGITHPDILAVDKPFETEEAAPEAVVVPDSLFAQPQLQPETASQPGQESVSTTVSQPGQASTSQPAPQCVDPNVPVEMVSGMRYVALGVFSTPENAARAVREVLAKESSLHCRIYLFGDKYMVSPFSSAEASACEKFIRDHADKFPGMWSYTAR